MYRFVFILIILFIGFEPCDTKAQNLLSDGGFESNTSINCIFGANFHTLTEWQNIYNLDGNSPDYYTSLCSYSSNASQPTNCVGVQVAKEGFGYAGAIFFHQYDVTFSEYLCGNLKEALKQNYIYCLSYYISLSDNSKYACKNMGALFTNNIPIITPVPIGLIIDTPQIIEPNIITDKTNWVKISGNFIAKGGEKYITIGRFKQLLASDVQFISTPPTFDCTNFANAAYYYIDSVSLTVCDSIPLPPIDTSFTVLEPTLPNVFTPNGDGVNDVFKFELKQATLHHFNVYDRWGLEMKNEKLKINDEVRWDGKSIQGDACPAGVYFYVLEYEDSKHLKHKKRGYITLMR
jgi:gliding motility-associated-like protein